MAKQTSPDRAYLIRCWQEQNTSPETRHWRFSIEEVLHNGKRQGFLDLPSLIAFLCDELQAQQGAQISIPSAGQNRFGH